MMSGLVNGIYAGWSWVVNAASSVARSALNAAKSFLGIASPSKEFAKVGKFTMEGFAQGIERTAGEAEDAVQKAMEDVASVQAPEISTTMTTDVYNDARYGAVIDEIGKLADSIERMRFTIDIDGKTTASILYPHIDREMYEQATAVGAI
jgi:phage-related protein